MNSHLCLPDLIAATHPEVRLRRAGQGWIGWCLLHDDKARQAEGLPGSVAEVESVAEAGGRSSTRGRGSELNDALPVPATL